MCKFVYIEMSKNTNVSLEELYTTDDLTLLKKSIAELTAKKDYKTLNTLFRRNPNTSKFDTRTLNEDVPQKNKRFTKRNGKLCNVSRTVPQKQENTPQSDKYEAHLYDPNNGSYGYISRIRSRYYST